MWVVFNANNNKILSISNTEPINQGNRIITDRIIIPFSTYINPIVKSENSLTDNEKLALTAYKNSFSPPEQESLTPSRTLSKWGFRKKFTFAERIAITASNDVGIVTLREDLLSAPEVTLDDPFIEEALTYLISKNLLTTARKTEILA